MMIRVLVVMAALCLAESAQAQVVWSMPAGSCVPTEATIESGRYKVNTASVQHAGNKVGLIVLNCPIARFDNPKTVWNHLMEYQDSTGTGTTALVRTRLYRLPFGSETPILMATANSNGLPSTTFNLMSSQEFTHTFDFDLATYWIRAELNRASSSETVVVHSVRLTDNE
jgi:hypothetical protein